MNKFAIVLTLAGAVATALGSDFVMPDVELKVRVVGVEGTPIPDAQVGAFFPHVYGAGAPVKGESKKALTDTEGTALLVAKTASSVGGGVEKPGYYRTQFEEVDFMKMRDEVEPLRAEREAVLKKIRNPVPMIARQFGELTVPVENDPCGFDFEVGDWVAPRGTGKTADTVFNIAGSYPSYKEFDATLEISFPNDGDGIIRYEGAQHVGSELKSDYEAPEGGYLEELNLSNRAKPGQTTAEWINESKSGSNYYFRVRTVLDEQGNVIRANYGKIYGPFEFGRYKNAEKLYLKGGTYYFNPAVNNRNVEFDRSKNLAEEVTPSKSITLP